MALLDILVDSYDESVLLTDLPDGNVLDIVSNTESILNIPLVVGGGGGDFEYVYGFFS